MEEKQDTVQKRSRMTFKHWYRDGEDILIAHPAGETETGFVCCDGKPNYSITARMCEQNNVTRKAKHDTDNA